MIMLVSIHTSDSTFIGLDLWKQLKQVTIPVFTDDKKSIRVGRLLLLLV